MRAEYPLRNAYRLRSATADWEAFRNVMPARHSEDPPRIPEPSHRHGAPSGPWPFLDLNDPIDPEQLKNTDPSPPTQICDHLDAAKCKGCWSGYPQSLFPNWTPAQQRRSQISKIVDRSTDTCVIRYVDVDEKGEFSPSEDLTVTSAGTDAHWQFMRQPRPEGTRLRAMFVENLSGPVLQMLGTKYNIEPFYFSSSIGWIPSRFQEELKPDKSDHITITLSFIRTMKNPSTVPPGAKSSYTSLKVEKEQVIDTQTPLSIRSSGRILLPDLLALHMVRSPMNSTIISYHPSQEHRTTTASWLHARLNAAGHSVYWNTIFKSHDDPTFIFLSILWYALYAWDEAFEVLYTHICWLEARVIDTNNMDHTQELHVIQAHLLHYASLLDDFRKSVKFVVDTPYPALNDPDLYSVEEKDRSIKLMGKECKNLLNEIDRLKTSQEMQSKRLTNVMRLGFNSVNMEDSKHMQKLTQATVKDSEAMKQVAYLTMFFLPASFAANVFGMNINEINPGSYGSTEKYLATAIPLTVLTIWVVVAFQYHPGHPQRAALREGGALEDGRNERWVNRSILWNIFGRIAWPFMLGLDLLERLKDNASNRPN